MQRIAKFSLYGLVLAAMGAGSLAWVHHDNTVDLRIDGQDRTVHTSASDVRGVLSAAHVTVGDHDIIAPDLSARVRDGSRVVVRRGHLLHLKIDGQSRDVWVNADSVDEALGQLGYTSGAFVSVSRSQRLDAGATSVDIASQKHVTFLVDGKRVAVLTPGPTVYQAIADAGIYLGPQDRVSAKGNIRDGELIRIQRVTYQRRVVRIAVPFNTVRQNDPSRLVGTSSVVRDGRNGSSTAIYQFVYVDGKFAGKVRLSLTAGSLPISQIKKVGSKPAPVEPAAASSSTSSSASASSSGSGSAAIVPAGTAQQIAAGMVARRGWGSDQFTCLVNLWNRESGWRVNAANPSGAYGIPQALPGSKMASAGPDWQSNATTQITWGIGYIAGVYGTPCGAWAHSQAYNWY